MFYCRRLITGHSQNPTEMEEHFIRKCETASSFVSTWRNSEIHHCISAFNTTGSTINFVAKHSGDFSLSSSKSFFFISFSWNWMVKCTLASFFRHKEKSFILLFYSSSNFKILLTKRKCFYTECEHRSTQIIFSIWKAFFRKILISFQSLAGIRV